MKKYIRRIGGCLLTGAMLLSSFAGCGKKDTTVVDYGVDPSNTEAVVSTPGDGAMNGIEKSTKTLEEQFGKMVKWNETFTAQDITFSAKYTMTTPNVDYLNMYRVKKEVFSTEGEKKFADGFFDTEAKKLEKLQYNDSTKYMLQMYQYRNILYKIGVSNINYNSMTEEEVQEATEYDNSVITSNSDIDYGWVDADGYSIHMYEGTYNGVNFGLIIGYDFLQSQRFVYFEPTDISEYFPGSSYQTLMLEGSMLNSYDGEETSAAENQCTMSEQEVYDAANEFIQSRFNLSEYDGQLTDDYNAYNMLLADVSNNVYSYNYEDVPSGMSMMTFTDGDYISSSDVCVSSFWGYRSAERLAEQTDYVYQYMEDMSVESYWDALYSVKSNASYIDKNVSAVRDGYAVYLNSPFSIGDSDGYFLGSYYSDLETANAGCVMITSKGIFGVEMATSISVQDVTEGVALMEFDGIKDACIKAIDEKLDASKLGKESFHMDSMGFTYEATEDEDGDGEFEVVPCWYFSFSNNIGMVYVVINAVDGSLILTEQYYYY